MFREKIFQMVIITPIRIPIKNPNIFVKNIRVEYKVEEHGFIINRRLMVVKYIKTIFIVCLLFILSACESPNVSNPAPTDAEKSVVVDGSRIAVNQIHQEIKRIFNNVLYYSIEDLESEYFTVNPSLILNKTLVYDLYFFSDENRICVVFTNIDHPYSTAEQQYYYSFTTDVTTDGLRSVLIVDKIKVQETKRSAFTNAFLETHSLFLEEIVRPQHEIMSEEWKTNTEESIRIYMDNNNFSSIKDKNLRPGNYHVYVQGFDPADEDSTIAFEHEDGTIYFGSFYFVHNIILDRPANLNHVGIPEYSTQEECAKRLEKIRSCAVISMEYAVSNTEDVN